MHTIILITGVHTHGDDVHFSEQTIMYCRECRQEVETYTIADDEAIEQGSLSRAINAHMEAQDALAKDGYPVTREELIEEAAKAIWEESTDPSRKWHWEDESGYVADEYANQARAAFAVFEKAQAPTDELNTSAKKVSMSGGHVNKTADSLHVPTDAQVIEALNAWHQDVMPANRLGVFGTWKEDRMRAALKAAFTAGQEDKP